MCGPGEASTPQEVREEALAMGQGRQKKMVDQKTVIAWAISAALGVFVLTQYLPDRVATTATTTRAQTQLDISREDLTALRDKMESLGESVSSIQLSVREIADLERQVDENTRALAQIETTREEFSRWSQTQERRFRDWTEDHEDRHERLTNSIAELRAKIDLLLQRGSG
ncbi:MAG: hypothetical protein R3253_05195 [Longimicrobiales bacterium]|nr:hypothetical protein [Longimicrobiales bacterium]